MRLKKRTQKENENDKAVRNVIKALSSYQRFLITTHTNMEGDALGSELSLYYLLRRLKKKVFLLNDDVIPYGYSFLPFLDRIQHYHHGMKIENFDCLCVVDCSDISRTGQVQSLCNPKTMIVNIDHHISNSYFGTVNFVDPKASCCCELIWRLYKACKVEIDRRAALLLYTGILTDTGSFRYTNTSSVTHQIVAELLSKGVNPSEVYREVYGQIPLTDMKLLLAVLPTMRTYYGGALVTFEMPRLFFPRHQKICVDVTEYVLSFGRSLAGSSVVVLFKENLSANQEVRVNFRSHGSIDVNRIAEAFGGGGHTTAAGATVSGSLSSVKRKVIAYIGKVLKGKEKN